MATSFEIKNNQTKLDFKTLFNSVSECKKLKKSVIERKEEDINKFENKLSKMPL